MVVGIDLGTCNTLAATVTRDGQPILIPDARSKELITPSLVLIEGKMAMVGGLAMQYMDIFPEKNFIRYYKRNFGTEQPVFFDEEGNGWYSETIAAMMLKKLRNDADMFQPEEISQVVVTVPAHYNDAQRKSVIEAAKIAEINLSAIIDEPIAAALSYMNSSPLGSDIVMVYDFGGGTFDLTFIVKNGNHIHVLAKDGLSDLGGKEFDEIISQRILEEYEKCFGKPINTSIYNSNKLRSISEKIKMDMCGSPPPLYSKWLSFDSNAFEFCLSKKEFEKKSAELVQKTRIITERCLKSIGVGLNDISQIILVGGTSHIPFIRGYWAGQIDRSRQKLVFHEPFSSVALGAAAYAATMNYSDHTRQFSLNTVSTYNIGIKNADSPKSKLDILIHKNLPLPTTAHRSLQVMPNVKTVLSFVQSFDARDENAVTGTLVLGPYSSEVKNVELLVENKANGTISIKVKDAESGKSLKFAYEKLQTKYHYELSEQRALINSININNIN